MGREGMGRDGKGWEGMGREPLLFDQTYVFNRYSKSSLHANIGSVLELRLPLGWPVPNKWRPQFEPAAKVHEEYRRVECARAYRNTISLGKSRADGILVCLGSHLGSEVPGGRSHGEINGEDQSESTNQSTKLLRVKKIKFGILLEEYGLLPHI